MRHSKMLAAVTIAATAALLTACQPTATTPDKSSSSSPSPSPSTSDSQPAYTFPAPPADAVLTLTGMATADNGAVLALSVTVHSSWTFDSTEAAAANQAISAWCQGEVDSSMLADFKASFTTVDYSAVQVGTAAWPSDLPIALTPFGQPLYVAATGDVAQLEILSQNASPGDYIPHCLQQPFLQGVGSGSTYVAISGDSVGTGNTPPLQGWAGLNYGFNTVIPAGTLKGQPFAGVPAGRATLTECKATITSLGSSSGAPSANWKENFQAGGCSVGGS
ncbi:MAG: hypothetical protein KF742_00785 [Cryobacterium sp.]|nr:hypothetical protein [Cryobacterium sp.]